MTTPLDTNASHIGTLCQQLNLGLAKGVVTAVKGGFHHSMWCLETTDGRYAVKQLAADVDLGDRSIIEHYESTEAVAQTLASRGIPALCALGTQRHCLQVMDGSGYLVYPWTDAAALRRWQIAPAHVEQVARIFARIHLAKVEVPGLYTALPEIHPEEKLQAIVDFARSRNSRRTAELTEHLPIFQAALEKHNQAVIFLSGNLVASHGDLDHKNILWESATAPLLIDWESARLLNPTHEVILEALDWSGITLDFNESLFDCFIDSYLGAGAEGHYDEVEAAFHCVLGDWVNWLMYNVGRSIDLHDEAQRSLGQEQVDMALATILRLERLIPRLLRKVDT